MIRDDFFGEGGPPARGFLDGPLLDDRALVFRIDDSARERPLAAGLAAGEPAAGGLDAVLRYVADHPGVARLSPVSAARVQGAPRDAVGLLAGAGPSSTPEGKLSGTHVLRAAAAKDTAELLTALRADPRITYAHRPAIQYPLIAPRPRSASPGERVAVVPNAAAAAAREWGMIRCGFPEVWDRLEVGDDPGPIAVIDAGGDTRHPELEGRVTYIPPEDGVPSRSIHAGAVAGVIAAIRGNDDATGMRGCCSAMLRIYNVWNETDFAPEAYCRALTEVAADRLPVVNLSLGSRTPDPTIDAAIRGCIDAGVVVVAAMGDYAREGSPRVYPAANPDVIAVGGTGRFDQKTEHASTGGHIWLSAPADDIWTIRGDDGFRPQFGTSFAAAMVSAAAWLARRGGRARTPAEIRDLLRRSVDGRSVKDGRRSDALGYGRLDMVKLAALV